MEHKRPSIEAQYLKFFGTDQVSKVQNINK